MQTAEVQVRDAWRGQTLINTCASVLCCIIVAHLANVLKSCLLDSCVYSLLSQSTLSPTPTQTPNNQNHTHATRYNTATHTVHNEPPVPPPVPVPPADFGPDPAPTGTRSTRQVGGGELFVQKSGRNLCEVEICPPKTSRRCGPNILKNPWNSTLVALF